MRNYLVVTDHVSSRRINTTTTKTVALYYVMLIYTTALCFNLLFY